MARVRIYAKYVMFLHYSDCRFFVVEDHILHVTQGLVTGTYTTELWTMAQSKIIAALRTHSVSDTDHGFLL